MPGEDATTVPPKYLCCCGNCHVFRGARIVYYVMLLNSAVGVGIAVFNLAVAVTATGARGCTYGLAPAAWTADLLLNAATAAVCIVGIVGLRRRNATMIGVTARFFLTMAVAFAVSLVVYILFYELGGWNDWLKRNAHAQLAEEDRNQLTYIQIEERMNGIGLSLFFGSLVNIVQDSWFASITRAAHLLMREQTAAGTEYMPGAAAANYQQAAPLVTVGSDGGNGRAAQAFVDAPPKYDEVVDS